jgi:hypothetical protein
VGDGGSLLWIGNFEPEQRDYIYALGGGSCWEDPGYGFFRYRISADSWEKLEDLPYPVGNYNGNRLAYAGGRIYCWQGTPSTWPGGGNAFYGSIVSWLWEFGDNGTSTERNPTHRYSGPGTYAVRLTVTDNGGGHGENPAHPDRLVPLRPLLPGRPHLQEAGREPAGQRRGLRGP